MMQGKRLKIGTFKVDAHGTKLGERLLKKALDHAIAYKVNEVYITIFKHHSSLIKLLESFGFTKYGTKTTVNGSEIVLIKNLTPSKITRESQKDYPLIEINRGNDYILGIYPQWHSLLFPDSLLVNEHYDVLSDISHTNSITKLYVCAIRDALSLKPGDKIVIYRTKDDKGPAEYRSVATSICIVEEVKQKASFSNVTEYLTYASRYIVFGESDLKKWWTNQNVIIIKMLYNAAMTKRVVRKSLIENIGLDRHSYWGFMPLTKEQFINILKLGGVSERLIVS
jgi:bifunctional DNA-binding transcriptional regulator/antitoxin component of YhaV-PrlF toxin-antitoxin module